MMMSYRDYSTPVAIFGFYLQRNELNRPFNTQFDTAAPKVRHHLDKNAAWKSEDWPELLVVSQDH